MVQDNDASVQRRLLGTLNLIVNQDQGYEAIPTVTTALGTSDQSFFDHVHL